MFLSDAGSDYAGAGRDNAQCRSLGISGTQQRAAVGGGGTGSALCRRAAPPRCAAPPKRRSMKALDLRSCLYSTSRVDLRCRDLGRQAGGCALTSQAAHQPAGVLRRRGPCARCEAATACPACPPRPAAPPTRSLAALRSRVICLVSDLDLRPITSNFLRLLSCSNRLGLGGALAAAAGCWRCRFLAMARRDVTNWRREVGRLRWQGSGPHACTR